MEFTPQKIKDQEKYFDGLGFERHDLAGYVCYKGDSPLFYRMDHFGDCFVLEIADDEDSAKKNWFEDAESFPDDLTEAELIAQVQETVLRYEEENN